MSQPFAWGGQSIGVSASASVLPMNTQDWPLCYCCLKNKIQTHLKSFSIWPPSIFSSNFQHYMLQINKIVHCSKTCSSHCSKTWPVLFLLCVFHVSKCSKLQGERGHRGPILILFDLSSSVQLLSHVWLFVTPWTAACQTSLSLTNSWNLLKLMSIESVMPSNHLILYCLLLLPPWTFPRIRVFSNESALRIRWPKDWSFSFNISPSNEYSRLISFRMYWLDLLAVQRTLKSLPQHHSSKASILQHSAFFTVQFSHPYMTIG